MSSSRLEESARERGRTHESERCARRAGRELGPGMRWASPKRTSNVDVGVAEMKIMNVSARAFQKKNYDLADGVGNWKEYLIFDLFSKKVTFSSHQTIVQNGHGNLFPALMSVYEILIDDARIFVHKDKLGILAYKNGTVVCYRE